MRRFRRRECSPRPPPWSSRRRWPAYPGLEMHPDLILVNGNSRPSIAPIPTRSGRITRGRSARSARMQEMLATRGPETKDVDLGGRRAIPGLIDSHIHVIRGGLNYNMELRWEGVPSLADAMAMLKRQAERTPPPQWVRVVGGFTEHQFAESACRPSMRSTRPRPTRRSSSCTSTTARC